MIVVPAALISCSELPHRAADLDVHARGGLVEDQQARLVHHRAGDHQPPLHAAGQRAAASSALSHSARASGTSRRARARARQAVEAAWFTQDVERLLEHG
jgi:hypothetical protein